MEGEREEGWKERGGEDGEIHSLGKHEKQNKGYGIESQDSCCFWFVNFTLIMLSLVELCGLHTM